jgi:DNA-binding beta-propeller fold protein YncE
LHIVNASPAMVAAVPDSFAQSSNLGTISLGVDGGYYGSTGGLVNLTFADQATIVNSAQSGPRQIFGTKDNAQLPSPGLYEVSVTSSTTQGVPPMFPTVTTNVAVQPAFATAPVPTSVPLNPAGTTGTNLAPSAMALNSVKGYAVIVEQATSTLQLIDLTGATPVQVASPFSLVSAASPTASSPTDIAIDTQLSVNGGDLGVVVSGGDSMLYLYSITPQAAPYFTLLKGVSVDLRTLLGQPTATGLPAPFAFGVDPGTHLGVVAYVNTNIGFIVDVNPNLSGTDTHACFIAGQTPPCVVAPVSINTGPSPRVVMQPNVPLAYVTPGGGFGSTSVVDLLQQGTSVKILPFSSTGLSGASRTAGITTIRTETPHGINPILGGTVIISGVTTNTANSNFNGTYQIVQVIDPFSFTYAQTGQPDDSETNTSSALGTVQYGMPYFTFSTSANVSGAAINPITRTFGYADFNQTSAQIGFISTLDQSLTSLTLTAGSCNTCTPTPAGAPERGFRSVAFDPFTNVMVAYNPSDNSGTNFAGNEISLINPGGPAPGGSTNFPYRIIAAISTGQTGTGSYTPAGQTAAVQVFGPMVYDPKTKFVLVANAGSNSLTYMNLDPGGTFQKAHIQDLQLLDAVPPYGVPVVQPPLSTSAPAKAPTTCSLTDPKQPCMPQAVRVGQPANLRILGQGFSAAGASLVVRLDGQTTITPPGSTTPVPIPAPTSVTDGEIDVTIPAAFLFAPHDYALDVQFNAGGVVTTTNSIDLHVVGLLDLAGACATSSSFPQGPEGVAIDESRQIALVSNYACNSVSVIAINPAGFVKSDGSIAPYGAILGTVAVGKNPIGIGVIPRMGLAVVANSGDTPNGTASIIDISKPDAPAAVGSPVTVGLSPLGVAVDQDRALALVANSGSNTLSSIDLTVLLPSDTGTTTGHVQAAPTATTVALSGPPDALAVDPNRAVAVVTSLQNSGTTSVTGGLDVVNLATTPPIKSSTSSVASLSASLTGIVYDPAPSPALFYATSTQQNAIYSFNPDSGSVQTIRVGINPFSVGYNYQTGTLLTINSTSNSSSVVDSQSLKTRQTLGISSLSQFAVAVDNFTNTAVIVDQNNNRVVFLNLPK